MDETDNDLLQNDNQEDRNVSSECEEDEGTVCEDGHYKQWRWSDTDW